MAEKKVKNFCTHLEFIDEVAHGICSRDPNGGWHSPQDPGLLAWLTPYEDGLGGASLFLEIWPTINQEGPFYGHPGGVPQVVIEIRYGSMSDEERFPAKLQGLISRDQWKRAKHRAQRDWFSPEYGAPFECLAQWARARGDLVLAECAEALYRQVSPPLEPKPLSSWRIWYVEPKKQEPDEIAFQLSVALLQDGLIYNHYEPPNPYEGIGPREAMGPRADIEKWLCGLPFIRRLCKEYAADTVATVLRSVVIPARGYKLLGSEDWRGLRKYVRKTADGLRRDETKKIAPGQTEVQCLDEARIPDEARSLDEARIPDPPRFLDAEETVLCPFWVAQKHGVHKITVERWMQEHGCVRVDGRPGLSQEEYEAFKAHRESKDARAALMDFMTERGRTPGAAKKWIQRQLGKGLNYQEMAQALVPEHTPK